MAKRPCIPRFHLSISAMVLAAIVCSMTLPAIAAAKTGMDWYSLGRSLQEKKQYEAALDAFQHAVDMHFQPAGALMRMAQIEAARGNKSVALEHLNKAYSLAPAALALLEHMGGIPSLAGDAQFQRMMDKADRARHPCKGRPESRQFDFWVGTWTVTNPRGQIVGHSHVTPDLEGCVVRESWTDNYGDRGTSVNFFDPATGEWHQVWTSDSGTVTHYEGSFSSGAMRFMANGFGDANGKTHFRRMTFTPNKDGSVRQLIEDSDDGKAWSTSFDGLYRKQP